ncbi:MAG: peptidyl-prolyl cis-trans isomerase [Candidatus Omnitrophica bacterium]|nr:peptidyl-prolyl cis-trans isomerase [Candidatus Omnitrophota bacterium]
MPEVENQKLKGKILNSLLIYSLTFLFFSFNSTGYPQDKIIAVVNSEVITQKDLDDFLNFMRMQLKTQYEEEELTNKIQSIETSLLERLIEDKLILQAAQKSKIRIDEARVKARLEEIKKRYGSDANFQEALMREGLTQSDIENKIREQFLMYTIIDEKIKKKIIINPKEVTDFYEKNIEEFRTPEVRQVSLIKVDSEEIARQIYESLKKEADLSKVAEEYAITLDRLDVTKTGELVKEIEDVVFSLEINRVSAPIKIRERFYIFKLDNITLPRQQSLTEVQDKIYAFLFDKKIQEELIRWLDELRRESYIQIFKN